MLQMTDFTPASEFVPAGIDAASWEGLAPLYAELAGRPVATVADLERLIHDRSDVDAAASEAGAMLYVNMTCHTDDPATSKAYLDHVQNVQPKLKEAGFELDKKITQSPLARSLDQDRYGIYLRNMRAGVEIFRQDNVPIETRLAELDQQYSSICGAMTVQFRGQERTLPQMSPFQEDTDRALREEAWRTVAERRYQENERLSLIFDEMVSLRHQIALNAGYDNFQTYSFKAKRRFEYTPEDCNRFAEGVQRTCVPAMRRLHSARASMLNTVPLRPWDMFVDVKGRGPLRPFASADELVNRTSRVFHRMEPTLGRMFDLLRQGHCLDLETRKGKAPGGYQANRDWIRMPFIFMNAAGIQRDVETIVHEAGHAFHALLARHDALVAYRSEIPLEFAEVASMSMELAAHDFLEEYYPSSGPGPSPDASRARRNHLEQISALLPIVAAVDQFQHWIYTNPTHTRKERAAFWMGLNDRFGGLADWTGIEHLFATSWQRILHLFGSPFYYIEYGIAQLGAIQLWLNYKADHRRAIRDYAAALALGGSRPIPDLYRAANLTFDMGPGIIANLWGRVEAELAKLPE